MYVSPLQGIYSACWLKTVFPLTQFDVVQLYVQSLHTCVVCRLNAITLVSLAIAHSLTLGVSDTH